VAPESGRVRTPVPVGGTFTGSAGRPDRVSFDDRPAAQMASRRSIV